MRSEAVGGWLFAVNEGQRLRIADDQEGTRWWASAEETAKEAEQAERAAKEAALARVAELEAELARRR